MSASKIKVLWTCAKWPGGRHWYVELGILNPDGEGYSRTKGHSKFASHERALMWIEREFLKLGDSHELWDFNELINGLDGMRREIRRRADCTLES